MVEEKLNQMHKVLGLIYTYLEEHYRVLGDENFNALYSAMYDLDEMMKPLVITSEMVRKLSEITGEGLIACLKALKRARGDMNKAKEYLR